MLSAAERESRLEAEDLDRLATAAYLLGMDDGAEAAWTRAHHGHCARGDLDRAARSAFWVGVALLERGDTARASGWLGRARRMLGEEHDSAEQGYLLIAAGLRSFQEGDCPAAADFVRPPPSASGSATPISPPWPATPRAALMLWQQQTAAASPCLDEVMVAVMVGRSGPDRDGRSSTAA